MSFPTTPILDSGVGTDADPIAGNWAGPTYAGELELRRSSNTLQKQVGASDGSSYWNASVFGPDVEAYVTLGTRPDDGGPLVQVEARLDPIGAPNGYVVRFLPDAGGDIIRIRIINAGSTSALGADIIQNIENGDSFGIQCLGSSISAYWKPAAGAWTLLGTRTDATYIQAGRIALTASTSGTPAQLTNFGGGTVDEGGPGDDPPIGFLGRGAGW